MNERIESIDVLRGFALLGILIMNITSFAMPSMAYFSPVVYDINTLNHVIFSLTHIIATLTQNRQKRLADWTKGGFGGKLKRVLFVGLWIDLGELER